MDSLKCVGVLAHPLRPGTDSVAKCIVKSLETHNIETFLYTNWQEADVQEQVREADMVVAIGGDGAMLRAVRVCAPCSVPVLGVNMGQLGFLTEISSPDKWEDALKYVMAGEYWIEERMMLYASVLRDDQVVATGHALNDAVISGLSFGRINQLEAYIDGNWATTYRADALVISTATGSTAYALACGGPILPPGLHNILIVPSAAHLSMNRPIVLSKGATVEIEQSPDNENALKLTADGTILCQLADNDRVCIRASDRTGRFVRLRGRNYFYRSLLDRLEPRVSRSTPRRR